MKIVVLESGKGGVGKSLLSAEIAYIISKIHEKRSILVGADPSSKTIEFLLEGKEIPEYGWIDYLTTDYLHFEEIITESTVSDNLFVAYSTRERILHGEFEDPNIVAEKISKFKDYIAKTGDFVVIDAPAGLSVDHLLYTLMFDAYVVTTPLRPDIEGAKNFIYTIEKEAKSFGISKPFKGLIVNKVMSEREAYSTAEELNIPLITGVPYDKEVEKAVERRKLPSDKTKFALSVYKIVEHFGFKAPKSKFGIFDAVLKIFKR